MFSFATHVWGSNPRHPRYQHDALTRKDGNLPAVLAALDVSSKLLSCSAAKLRFAAFAFFRLNLSLLLESQLSKLVE